MRWKLIASLLSFSLPAVSQIALSATTGELSAPELYSASWRFVIPITGTGTILVNGVPPNPGNPSAARCSTGMDCGAGIMLSVLKSASDCTGSYVTEAPAYLCITNDSFQVTHHGFDWSQDAVYALYDVVTLDGVAYKSLAGSNFNNPPAGSPSFWASAGESSSGGSGIYNYTAIVSSPSGCSGTCTISYTVTILPRLAHQFTDANGNAVSGCVNSGYPYWNLDTCTASPAYRPEVATAPPAQGGTYADGNFGGVVTAVGTYGSLGVNPPAGGRIICNDAIVSCISSDRSTVLSNSAFGNAYLTNPATGLDLYNNIPATASGITYSDRVDPTLRYYFGDTDGTLHRVRLIVPCPLGGCAANVNYTDTVIYNYGSAVQLGAAHDNEVSADNWMAFGVFSGGPDLINRACIINLNAPSQAYCSAIFTGVDLGSRQLQLSPGVDAVSGYRYVLVGVSRAAILILKWAPGDTALTRDTPAYMPGFAQQAYFRYWGPPSCTSADIVSVTPTDKCYFAAHSSFIEIVGPAGPEEYYLAPYQHAHPFIQGLSLIKLNTGPLMTTPAAVGGGLRLLFPNDNAAPTDIHVGTSSNYPVALVTKDSDNVALNSYLITAFKTGTNPSVTTSPNYVGSNGDTVFLSAVQGFSSGAANGTTCVVAGLSGATFTCSGITTSGTYMAATGVVTPQLAIPSRSNQGMIAFVDFSHVTDTSGYVAVRFLAGSRSFGFTQERYTASGYYDQSHGVVSPDGKLACWESNQGLPDLMGVYCTPTGYVPAIEANPLRK